MNNGSKQTKSTSPETAEDHILIYHTLALIRGFDVMARTTTTLGEKALCRSFMVAAEEEFKKLGGQIYRTDVHPTVLVIPGSKPEIRFDDRDIDLMRECVARYDREAR